MKNKKIFLIILGIIVISIVVLLILINLIGNDKKIKANINTQLEQTQDNNAEYKRTNNTKMFFTVDERIKSYMDALKNNNNEVLLSYLNEDYISSNGKDENRVVQTLQKYNNYDSYITLEMYEAGTDVYTIYTVKGRIDGSDVFFNVGLDKKNMTFDITPIDEKVYSNKIEEQKKNEDYENISIIGKKYNFFNYKDLDNKEELVARLYYSEYIRAMLTDSQEAYNFLDKDYKEMRYDNIEKYREYINKNRDNLQNAYKIEIEDREGFNSYKEFYDFKQKNINLAIKKYSAQEYNDYTQYVCIDGYDNYYIFNVKYPGDYTVLLDTYTIDTPQFLEKYNNAKNEDKIAMNAEKIENALNMKDYNYVYSKLNETFKQNNYPSLEKFAEYIKNKLYKYNEFYYEKVTKQNDIYELSFNSRNLETKTEDHRAGTIIMQLKDGTDFEMSFNLE